MRIFVAFILLAFGLRPSADNSQQTTDNRLRAQMVTSCTMPEIVEGTTSGASTSSATAFPRTVDCCPLSVDDKNYDTQLRNILDNNLDGCLYLIVTPDNSDIAQWADTLARFRNEQGIYTKVVNIIMALLLVYCAVSLFVSSI